MADEYTPRLKEQYYATVRDELQKQFNYKNVMMIPKIEKIVVNMGVGEAATDSKAIDGAVADLRAITGQQPLITKARKSIATFKLRAGMPIGAKVTLRGDHTRGMDITIVTTAATDEEGKALLDAFHFPFKAE